MFMRIADFTCLQYCSLHLCIVWLVPGRFYCWRTWCYSVCTATAPWTFIYQSASRCRWSEGLFAMWKQELLLYLT